MSRSPQDVYARHLLSSRGYPLWIPEPSHQILLHRPDGLRIGDVGVVVPEDGGFEVFFNICLPREHPFHRSTGVPANFEHVELRDEDIRIIPNVEPPARIISTSSVTNIRTVQLPSETPDARLGGLGYEFDLQSSGGALLILPEGATRHDLRNRRLFFDEATKHGVDWYRFAEEHLGRMISHDSLYLITGFYKATSWSLAAFENVVGGGDFSAQFKMTRVGASNIAGTYTWETTRALDWRVGPVENYGIPNQSVFIRGFKIALRAEFLGKPRIEVKVGAPGTHSEHERFSGAGKRDSWISRLWEGLHPGSTTGSAADRAADDSRGGGWPTDVEQHVVIRPMPESSQIFHPSDIINKHLLHKETSANIAVTHDDDWVTILEKGLLKPEEFMQANSFSVEEIISNTFYVVSQDGAVFLQGKRRTDVNENKGVNEVIAEHLGQAEVIAENQPMCRSVGTHGGQYMGNEKFDSPLDVEVPPPVYTMESPGHVQYKDMEKKSHLFSDSLCVQTLGIHWLLLPYDPVALKPLLRFDIIFPVDKICFQHGDNLQEMLTEEELDALASTESITKMTITFEQWPFSWTIDVNNPDGIRCRHIFEAIYNSFQQQLTLGELWRVPDRQACEDAFRLRTLVLGNSQTERSLGWKRVDVLLHHTIFHGLTMHPTKEKATWVLNLGAPMPASQGTDPDARERSSSANRDIDVKENKTKSQVVAAYYLVTAEKQSAHRSVGTKVNQDMGNELFDSPLDVQVPPPLYRMKSPVHLQYLDMEKKSYLFPELDLDLLCAQTSGIHWLLLPYDPRSSKPLVRFDIILPVDKICYQYSDNVRETLSEEDLDTLASIEPITKMTISFEQWPFNWTIDVDNPNGIRCRHVFEAIYNSFQQQLTLGELWRVPDRRACEDSFRLRTLVLGNSQTEQSLGWKRVDVLLHHTIFHGLIMHPTREKGSWVLNLGTPMPIPQGIDPTRSPNLLSFRRRDSFLTVEESDGSSDDDECELTPLVITSVKGALSPLPSCDLAPSFGRGSYPTEVAATRGSLSTTIPELVLEQQTVVWSRPIHRPQGPRQRPNP